jgi:hypothetical protein
VPAIAPPALSPATSLTDPFVDSPLASSSGRLWPKSPLPGPRASSRPGNMTAARLNEIVAIKPSFACLSMGSPPLFAPYRLECGCPIFYPAGEQDG